MRMKKSVLLAVGAVLSWGCTEPVEKAADACGEDVRPFPVAEARHVFEEMLADHVRTRAEAEESGFFEPGDIEPVWAEAQEVPAEEFARVDVPVDATYGFFRFVSREESDTLDLAAVPRTLVVMKDPDSDRRSVYFCHYIADNDFARWYADRPQREWVDGQAKNYFSGIVLYTTLAGRIAAAGRCDHGRLTKGIFFGAPSLDREEALDRFSDLLGITYIARSRSAALTKGVNDNNMIEEVVILGPKKEEEDPFVHFDRTPEVPQIRLGRGGGGSGGGGSGGGSGGSGSSNGRAEAGQSGPSSPCPKLQTKDADVIMTLNELDKDCMAFTLFRALQPYVTVVPNAIAGSGCKTTIEYSLNGDQITHQQFKLELGTDLKDIALLEEIIHIYQYTGRMNTPEDRLNIEVEAKLGWYMYRERINKLDDISRAVGGDSGIIAFDKLGKCYKEKDFGSSEFYEAYNAAIVSLRNIGAYRDETKYMADPNACHFQNLEKLMKNC